MSTFTPPSANEAPNVLPDGDPEQTPLAVRLMRFYRSRPTGINVYLYKAGSLSEAAHGRVTEEDPVALYDSTTGVLTTNGWDDIEMVFWGGHGPYDLISDWASVLSGAGYTVT